MEDVVKFEFSTFFIFRALVLPGILLLFTTCCLLVPRALSKNVLPPLISFDFLLLILLLASAKKYYTRFRNKEPVLTINGDGISFIGSCKIDVTWDDVEEIKFVKSNCLAINLADRKTGYFATRKYFR